MTELATERLLLRQWRDDDRAPFAALNADPEVMRYFSKRLTSEESDGLASYIWGIIDRQGWGLWAVEVQDGAPFIGFVGLGAPGFEAHFTPAIEVGWRLHRDHWGRGYATEAAIAALTFAFEELNLPEVVSFTTVGNDRSRRMMERLGMSRNPGDDFDHPSVPDGPLRRHVLYRIRSEQWQATRSRTGDHLESEPLQ
ncbi:MAG: GNAT family N-acetyltransferase [Solirubrobacteraceae bacterium]